MDRNRLEGLGIDLEGLMERLMSSTDLLERLMKAYLEDKGADKLKEAVEQGDPDAALMASHSLKGLSANLGLTKLHELTSTQCSLFRSGLTDQAFGLAGQVLAEDRRLKEGIRHALQ